MYTEYWGLHQHPFEERHAVDLYFPASSTQAALLKLRYLIDQRKGVAVIAGEHGLGKSLLAQVFEQEIPDVRMVSLLIPQLSPDEMLMYLACQIGCQFEGTSNRVQVLRALEDRLSATCNETHLVMHIDDAHLLEPAHLNSLRLLLGLNETGRADFSLILSGRTQLLGRLSHIEALDSRIALKAALTPLRREELLPYVRHRMQKSGGLESVFTDECLAPLWQHTHGIPRKINQICDLALLVGFVDQLKAIGSLEIRAAVEELSSAVQPMHRDAA